MRTKIAAIVVLAGFLAVSAIGAGIAGADPLGEGQAVEAPPTTTTTVPSLQAPACANGVDDDGDGLIDTADPDCSSPSDTSEAPSPASGAEGAQGAAPAEATPAKEGAAAGVKHGSTIGGGNSGAVVHNQSLAEPGTGKTGGVGVPSATGGGDQPLSEGPNGGAQFSPGGAPTAANPTTTIAPFGPAPIGVPNFVIDSFEIPPFLLPIYQACGAEYGIPWEVLAAINKIETGFGTNLNVSSAGAVGWMQFLPSSWETYGLDANGDGRKDPYNPVDAICAAAHYLKVAGGTHDLYNAILAYNHADWYAQEVLANARAYGKLPSDLVGSLTGLTEGAHFPVAADARYADDNAARAGNGASGSAAEVISSSPTPRGIDIFAASGSPVVAVNDGVIRQIGHSGKLGNFVAIEDNFGNRYTYAELGQLVRGHDTVVTPDGKEEQVPVESQDLRPRLRALPSRAPGDGGAQVDNRAEAAPERGGNSLRVGSRVIAGTLIGRVGTTEAGVDPHLNFAIRPAGTGAQEIDPKPILDGWKLLEATAIYRAQGKSPFAGELSGAGVLLLSKETLQKRVLADRGLTIQGCGRKDIASGQIDRRVLAMLEYLRAKGFEMKLASLKCDHGYLTSSGNVSEHSSGDAVDISELDGVPVNGHQGPGTLTDKAIHDVLQLQGTMHPHQVISLENLPGPTSFALPDHYDHIHVGYSATPELVYVSPFLNATEGRVDMGVDFTGVGPIAAIGDAKILKTGAPGWPEGGGVLYQLLGGPEAGKVIYVYEGVAATVKAGERVAAGQPIATFVPGGSIEIGFADANGAALAAGVYQEGDVTEWGKEMQSFLSEIGGSSALSLSFGSLPPGKWNRLIGRLGEIPNPTVPTQPSKYSLPDKVGAGTPAGGE